MSTLVENGVEALTGLIRSVRGERVMLDADLAQLYGVETKFLKRAVNRNIERFPNDFVFLLSNQEVAILRCQIGTSSINNVHGGRRYLPYVFTEHGVTMLASVLTSKLAITISMQIIDTFIAMRKYISENNFIDQRLNKLERTQINSEIKFEEIFKALEKKEIQPEKGIFFEGEIFDAYIFISNLIRKAEKSIILIDNYIDDSVLTLFSKRKKGVHIQLYTKDIPKQLHLDIVKFNEQYPTLEAKILKNSHDRFLIIDETELYHIGASLKDVGKKWFAFSKMDSESLTILSKLP